MDCCNYMQPYPGHSHFYQHQQHQFCYDNPNGYYNSAPISDGTIEANARYTTLHAYPTDYVYNPKEARLRKAMREQNRELSRQSMVSGPISSPDNSSTASSESTPTSTNYNLSMTCSSTPIGQSASYNPGRINPWFASMGHATAGEHVKQMLPYRMMQAHQRTFDKTKEVLRKQVSMAECSPGFPSSNQTSCYPTDYSHHHNVPPPSSSSSSSQSNGNHTDVRSNASTGLESNDYCGIGEFTDGQKWHPYQNGSTGYHPRAGPMTKISSRHAMQPSWNQFCGVPMPPMPAQNPMIRGPRHMVMMQDQRERHCATSFSDEISTMGYGKVDPRIAAAAASGYSQSTYREPEKCIEDNPRWPPPPTPSLVLQPAEPAPEEPPRQQPKIEETTKDYEEEELPQQPQQQERPPSKQPLPGFHQAFGSTEIGRFSRSEFFANMVSDNGVSKNQNSHKSPGSSSSDESSSLLHSNDHFNGLTSHYEGIRSSRWHSPYVSAIRGEI